MAHSDWQWYVGSNDEYFSVRMGPGSREEAIAEGRAQYGDQGFHIIEAQQEPFRLSQWIDIDRLLEDADENVSESDAATEYDDDGFFVIPEDARRRLEATIKAAIDKWQDEEKLVFDRTSFSAMRNAEFISGAAE